MISKVKQKAKNLYADPHMREVASGVVLAFSLKVLGAGLAFTFNVVIARMLGAEGTGLYFLALAITSIGSVIGRVGLDNTLLRFVATNSVSKEWGKVGGVYSLAMRIAILASGITTLLVFFIGPWMAVEVFSKPELVEPLRWMSLSILPFSILNLHAESLKGLKCIRDAMLIQGVGVPLIGLILLVPLARSSGVEGVSQAYLIATMITSVIGVSAWKRAVHSYPKEPKGFPLSELWKSSRPLFMVSFLNIAVTPWLPIFILGIWATSEEVGIFGAALRVAALLSFMLVAVNNVVAPKFAELHAKGDHAMLSQLARRSALFVTMIASPLLLTLIFGSRWIMGIYGEEFEQGAMVLTILAVGQFVNAFTGSVGFVLMMGGQEGATWLALLYSVLVLALLCLILIPMFGLLGAAVAVTVSGILKNILLVRYCIVRMGIIPIPFWGKGV